MGVSDVTLDSVIEQLDGSYSLYGENFTKQSKVYVNGEKQTSTFLNNTRLDLKDVELKDGDVIQVNQVGSSETIFRESAQYEYKDENSPNFRMRRIRWKQDEMHLSIRTKM